MEKEKILLDLDCAKKSKKKIKERNGIKISFEEDLENKNDFNKNKKEI